MAIRRASINSFGYGGANAHAIIESVESILPGYRSSRQASSSETQYIPANIINGVNNGSTSAHANGHANGHSNGQLNGYTNGFTNGFTNGIHNNPAIWPSRKQFLLPFSAHDEKTLKANVAALRETNSHWNLADIAYTLSERRSALSHRAFVVAGVSDPSEAFVPEKLAVTKKQGAALPVIGFVFTGTLRH